MRKYFVLRILKNGTDVESDDRLFDEAYEAEEWADYTYNRLTEKEKNKYRGFTVYEEEYEDDEEDEPEYIDPEDAYDWDDWGD